MVVLTKSCFVVVASAVAILSVLQLAVNADDSDSDSDSPSLLADYELLGSCTYTSQWTGPTCMEFRGEGWESTTMTERCAIEDESIIVEGGEAGCPTPPELAGWCLLTVAVDDTSSSTTKVEASSMMISAMAECSGNKMACETFVGGTWEDSANCADGAVEGGSDSMEEFNSQEEEMNDPPTSVEMNTAACDESFTSPVILPCSDPAVLMVSYDGSTIDCGGTISISQAATVPNIRVVVDDDGNGMTVDAEALYTLLLVDTTANAEGSAFGVHPILHYGAVNIPGSALLEGFSLDDDQLVDIFSDYRGPSPPSPEDPWSTPEIQETLFIYEYMLSAQPQDREEMDVSELVVDFSSVTRFDYENFFVETVGTPFENVVSTYFQSGRCINNVGATAAAEDVVATTTKTNIMIESFDDPKFLWESFTMDEDKMEEMKSMQDQYDYDFSNYDNEFQDGGYEEWRQAQNYSMTTGSSMDIVDGIMILTANISGDGIGNMVTMNARGLFPDLRTCDGLQFEVMTTRPGVVGVGNATEEEEYVFDGYKIEFGYNKLPDIVFGFGYRANLTVPIINSNSDTADDKESSDISVSTTRQQDIGQPSFMNVNIPFDDFTLDWNMNSGKEITSCIEDATLCPDEATLQNMETITISAFGTTNGVVQLHIKSIHGTGCDIDTNMDAVGVGVDDTMDVSDDKLTCSSDSATSDEIIIESFSNPSFDWFTQNDPVMGGESYSSLAMMETNGTAFFTGEVKDIPFLGVPGFIQMESRGGEGTYPDVSCCDSLKLTVMGMEDYDGYRVSFGTKRAKTGFFASGFKGNFDAPIGQYGDVVIPFNMFSVEWDEATGDQTITCAEDPDVCPDMETLENMKTIAIWGEGVGGEISLYVKSISAVGCSTPSSSSSSNDAATSSPSSPSSLSSSTSNNGLPATMLMGFVALMSISFTLFLEMM